jgi:beta-phosphoglucomutase
MMTMLDPSAPRFVFIFDLEGVLVDTAKYHYDAWNKIAKKIGFELTETFFNDTLKGLNHTQAFDQIIQASGVKLSDEDRKTLGDEKSELYLSNISSLNESDILPGVDIFLHEATRVNLLLAVASGSRNANLILEKTGLKKYFEVVIDGTMITNPKPDPEIFLMAARKFNYHPKRCVVFEDSPIGVMAGKKAGMYVVGLGPNELLSQADLTFDNLRKVRSFEIANWFSII